MIQNSEIEALTMEIVKQYYKGDPSLFFTYAHPQAVVLSVGKGQVIEGKDAIIQSFTAEQENSIRYDVMSMSCKKYPIARESINILLQMDLVAYFPDGRVTNVNQRLTACWKKIKNSEAERLGISAGWFFISAHLSVAMETQSLPTTISHLNEQILYETMGMYQRENKTAFRDAAGLTHYISASKIVRIQGNRQYSYVFPVDGERLRLHKRMADFEEELGEPFMRIHNSHLVNINYIKQFWNYTVILLDGTVLPVSRSCFAREKKAFSLIKRGIPQDDHKTQEDHKTESISSSTPK